LRSPTRRGVRAALLGGDLVRKNRLDKQCLMKGCYAASACSHSRRSSSNLAVKFVDQSSSVAIPTTFRNTDCCHFVGDYILYNYIIAILLPLLGFRKSTAEEASAVFCHTAYRAIRFRYRAVQATSHPASSDGDVVASAGDDRPGLRLLGRGHTVPVSALALTLDPSSYLTRNLQWRLVGRTV
jgi:hypothetical protein